MQFKRTSKDTCSDSLLPPSIDETSEGQTTPAACYHVHVNHYPGGTSTTEQRSCSADGSLPEKSPLTDVPLNSEQLSMKYNGEAPPPYKADSALQGVWSTETSKVHPGKPRIVSQNTRRLGLFCRSLLLLLSIALGVYLCFNAIPTLVQNYENVQKLRTVQREALQAVNVVEDIDNIPEEYEGKLIHVTGLISVNMPLSYEECGISAESIKLKRTFDTSHLFTKSEYEPYFMSDKWLNVRLGREHSCEIQDMSSYPDEKIADVAKIGSLELGHRIKEKFDEYYVITEKLERISDSKAFRVLYSDTGRNGTKYSVMGQLVNGSIQPYDLLDYYTIILQKELEVSAENMILDRLYWRMKTIDAENWWSYMEIIIGMLVSLTAIFHFMAFMKATKKNKRNPAMLSMPAQ